jgi:hypothetical protein
MTTKLDYKKMVEDINKLAETDFCFDMELKEMPNSEPYTQQEAKRMSDLLGRIYLISHCIHCEACQRNYKNK